MSSNFLLLLLLTILLQQSSQLSLENCNIIIHERKELDLRCKSRLQRVNSGTLYYSNSISSFNIVLSGDVKKTQDLVYPQNVPVQQNCKQNP